MPQGRRPFRSGRSDPRPGRSQPSGRSRSPRAPGSCDAPVMVPYELLLAVRYLRVQRGRTFLSVITMISIAGVAVGTAALVIALALMTGFEDDMRQRILRGSAHLQII